MLPSQSIRALIDDKRILASAPIDAAQIQPASLDLRLGSRAHRLQASFLPGNAPVESKLDYLSLAELDLSNPTILERGCVYLVPLMERLDLRPESRWRRRRTRRALPAAWMSSRA